MIRRVRAGWSPLVATFTILALPPRFLSRYGSVTRSSSNVNHGPTRMTVSTDMLAGGDEMIQLRHRIHAHPVLTKHSCDAIVFALQRIVSRNVVPLDMA